MNVKIISQSVFRKAKQQAVANAGTSDPIITVLSTSLRGCKDPVKQQNELRLFKYYGTTYVGVLFTFVKKTHEATKTPVKVLLKGNEEPAFNEILEATLALTKKPCSCVLGKPETGECSCK